MSPLRTCPCGLHLCWRRPAALQPIEAGKRSVSGGVTLQYDSTAALSRTLASRVWRLQASAES